MRAVLAIALIAALAFAGLLVWRGHRARVDHRDAQPGSTMALRPHAANPPLKRGSIAGTVTDDAARPIAGARVCARGSSSALGTEPFREPTCATSDAAGTFTIDGLLPARYAVTAAARPYRPALATRDAGIWLAEGAHVTGASIVLCGAGVELTGVVNDVTAGPVGHARVTAAATSSRFDGVAVTVEADDQGRFAMWVAPGVQFVTAEADGYADTSTTADAPGTTEIVMTPEATIEGVVLDAETGTPIAGASVGTTMDENREDTDHTVTTDARGEFRLERLRFGRFTIVARTAHRYGRSAGSLLVSLGQHQVGIVVRAYPARQVTGKVVIAPDSTACADSYGALRAEDGHWITFERAGDALMANGVPPGTWTPSISCRGFADRGEYEPLVVGDRDVTGVIWEVTRGGTLRGKVLTRSGAPIAGAAVYNQRPGRLADKFMRSREDGSYELVGLAPGTHQVHVSTDKAVVAYYDVFAVTIDGSETVEHDFVFDDAGSIRGTTVDADGLPVPDEGVVIQGAGPDNYKSTSAQSNEAGVFSVRGLQPGEYRVAVGGALPREDAPTITVRGSQVTTVKVLAAPKRSVITGQVVDSHGSAVSDALVVAASETRLGSEARSATHWFSGKPVLTSPGGTFVLSRLAAESYVVRAYRKGGGEAIVEHVRAGSSITLRIQDTATISGTVTDPSGAIQDLVVTVNDEQGAPLRSERFLGTQGAYAVTDLPQGHYTVQWDAEHGTKVLDVTLGDGETRRVDVALEPLLAVTGRVVDLRAHTPVPDIHVTAHSTAGDFEGGATSDAAGRFRIARMRPGTFELRLAGPDPYPAAAAIRTVDKTTGTIDIGDLAIVKARVTGDDPVGDLGFELDESRETRTRRECKVAEIDPAGPAVRSGLREGDVIVRVDGVDVTGPGYASWEAAVSAPPGTKLVFELARGATVSVVLARPKS